MQSNEIEAVRRLLYESIDFGIKQSIKEIVEHCKNHGNFRKQAYKPQEPDFVAGLSLYFTPILAQILRIAFPAHRFSVTGVFCHQKPIVDIGTPKNPEIGDLLVVYIHTTVNGEKKLNSLLLQAKISTRAQTKVAIDGQHQLRLYEKWPLFKYLRAGSLNGKSRDVQPKATNDGAQYLLIDDHPFLGLAGLPGTFPMGCAVANSTLFLNRSLADELIELLKFKSGRAFEEDPKATGDDWTKMIWDLLEITKGVASKRKNAGLKTFQRQSSHFVSGDSFLDVAPNSIFATLSGGGEIDNTDSKVSFEQESGDGISIIVIEDTDLQESNGK